MTTAPRTDSRAASATLRLHLDVSIPRQAQNRYAAPDALASATEATRQDRPVFRRTRRSRQARNTGPSLAGCLLTDRLQGGPRRLHRLKGGELLFDRLGDGHCVPASRDARAVLKNYCAFLHRNALTARTKQYGLTSRSMVRGGPVLSEACLLLRGQLTCLLSSPRWATRYGKLPAQTLKSMVPPCSIVVQAKWSKKRGAFGISRMMARRTAGDNPISRQKSAA